MSPRYRRRTDKAVVEDISVMITAFHLFGIFLVRSTIHWITFLFPDANPCTSATERYQHDSGSMKLTVVAWMKHSYANRQFAVDSAYRMGNRWLAAQTRIINGLINTKNGTKWSLTHQQTNEMTSSLFHTLHTVGMTVRKTQRENDEDCSKFNYH